MISSVIEKIKDRFDCKGNLTTDDTTVFFDRSHYLHLCALKGETSRVIVVNETKIKKAIIAFSKQIDFDRTTKKEFILRLEKDKNFYLTKNAVKKIEVVI